MACGKGITMLLRSNPYKTLERALGYRFRNRDLLEKALVHPSYRYETDGVDEDNQRLEFLGDAVLGMLAAAHLFDAHPDKPEGGLTMLRSQVTSGKALAGIGEAMGLGECLRMGKGEERSGGRRRASNLADAVEALIGASWIDGGMKAAEKVFRQLILPAVEGLGGDVAAGNPKGMLQELCQSHWKCSPTYTLLATEGPAHEALFTVEVRLPDDSAWTGQGAGKRAAETAAARSALDSLAQSAV
ncbi:MAG TPA: ribonuclease III [Verrucomicrobia bacterium]|nr:ribonuclease III [Verrucomicrobiota bacterium]